MLRLFEVDATATVDIALDRRSLNRIVGELRRRDDADPNGDGWWSRLGDWLAEQLRQLDWQAPQWMRDLDDEARTLGRVLQALLYVAIAIGGGFLAWRLVRRLRRRAPAGGAALGRLGRDARTERGANPDLDALRTLPVADQPAALLRYAVAVLRRQRLVSRSPGRTDAELAAEPALAERARRERFVRIAATAGRTLYGGRPPTAGELDARFDDAAALQAGPGS